MSHKDPYLKLVKSLTQQKRQNMLSSKMKHENKKNLIYSILLYGQHKEDDHTKPKGK